MKDDEKDTEDRCAYNQGRNCAYVMLDAALTHTGKFATAKVEDGASDEKTREMWRQCLADLNEARTYLKGFEAKHPTQVDVSELAKNVDVFRTISRAAAMYDNKVQHDAEVSRDIVQSFQAIKFNEFIGDLFAQAMPTPAAKA